MEKERGLMDRVIGAVFIVSLVFFGYLIFVWAPVSAYAEAECLRQGFPKAAVSVGLERYCMTIDGAIQPRVVRQ